MNWKIKNMFGQTVWFLSEMMLLQWQSIGSTHLMLLSLLRVLIYSLDECLDRGGDYVKS
jgi:hypothetical protein